MSRIKRTVTAAALAALAAAATYFGVPAPLARKVLDCAVPCAVECLVDEDESDNTDKSD